MADGPAGIRLHQSYEVDADSGKVYGKSVLGALENGYLEPMQKHENAKTYYQFCTAFPVGTAMAQTWNEELLQSFGRAVSHEMKEFHIDLWLAPGMNIQRNPLCGRNLNTIRKIHFSQARWLLRLSEVYRRREPVEL